MRRKVNIVCSNDTTAWDNPVWFFSYQLNAAQSLKRWSRNCMPFTKPEGSLPSSQQPTNGPYLDPDESNPYLHLQFHWDPVEYYFSIYAQGSKMLCSFWRFPTKILSAIRNSPMYTTCPTHLIHLYLVTIIPGEEYKLELFIMQFNTVGCRLRYFKPLLI